MLTDQLMRLLQERHPGSKIEVSVFYEPGVRDGYGPNRLGSYYHIVVRVDRGRWKYENEKEIDYPTEPDAMRALLAQLEPPS
jgi:hypothetical protein